MPCSPRLIVPPRVSDPGLFHLDDLGAGVSEQRSAIRAGDVLLQAEDTDSLE